MCARTFCLQVAHRQWIAAPMQRQWLLEHFFRPSVVGVVGSGGNLHTAPLAYMQNSVQDSPRRRHSLVCVHLVRFTSARIAPKNSVLFDEHTHIISQNYVRALICVHDSGFPYRLASRASARTHARFAQTNTHGNWVH